MTATRCRIVVDFVVAVGIEVVARMTGDVSSALAMARTRGAIASSGSYCC